MSAHLKRQHSIDEKSEVLDSKTVKMSPGTRVREFSLLQRTLCLLRGHACVVNMYSTRQVNFFKEKSESALDLERTLTNCMFFFIASL